MVASTTFFGGVGLSGSSSQITLPTAKVPSSPHLGADDPHLGAVDPHLGAFDLHLGAVGPHLGARDTHLGASDTHLGADDLIWEQGRPFRE